MLQNTRESIKMSTSILIRVKILGALVLLQKVSRKKAMI